MKINLKAFKTALFGSLLVAPLLFIGAKDVHASTVATVHSNLSYAGLKTQDGKVVSNRGLGANTPWQVGNIIKIDGTTYYQVATNEYLSSNDSDLSGQETNEFRLVGYAKDYVVYLVDAKGNTVPNRALARNSAWAIGKVIQNKNGDYFFQVSTNEYVKKSDMYLNAEPTNVEQIADFGINSNSNSNNNNSNNNNGSNNSNNNNNGNSGSNNSNNNNNGDSNSTTNGTVSSDGYSVYDTTKPYQPVATQEEMSKAIVDQINSERAKNGLYPLRNDNDVVNKVANVRGQELVKNYGHYRPNGELFNQAYQDFVTLDETSNYYDLVENVMSLGDGNGDGNHLTLKGLKTMAIEGFRGDPYHWGAMMTNKDQYVGIGVGYNYQMHCYFIAQEFANFDKNR